MILALLMVGSLVLALSLVVGFLFLYGRRLSPKSQASVSGYLPIPPDQARQTLASIEPNDPFGGKVSFELEPRQEGTRVVVFEETYLEPPVLRALAHLFIDRASTLSKKYGLN